jgi:anti-anti-sigma regulatory factor
MSTRTTTQAHIAYELIDERIPDVVLIEFLNQRLCGPLHARELNEQLRALIRPEFPRNYIIDFGGVRSLDNRAFGAIVSFARKVDRLFVCNMRDDTRVGASLSGLDDCAEFLPDRRTAINEARRAAMSAEQDTVDYPVWAEADSAAHSASHRV